jgi:GTP cyclohydrolase II
VAIEILNLLDVKEVNLLTNNPEKVKYVEESNIRLNARVPLQIPANELSRGYLKTKKDYFGHLLDDNDN